MNFLKTFDINQVVDTGSVSDYSPFPEGHYRVVCDKAEETTTKTSGTDAAAFEWTVSEGPHQGRKLWDTLHLDHPKIGGREQMRFRDLCIATGTLAPKTLGDFPGSDCVVDVKIKAASDCGTYKAKNEVKAYLAPVPTSSDVAPESAPKRAGNAQWQVQ